ncbi:MAG TPA: hypothetical protein VG294_00845 [Solirubrobacteraceae bacterium]|jgi:hypothetical protein|nr:hypothetical protein [Solirubrobacteraceae bacterium]
MFQVLRRKRVAVPLAAVLALGIAAAAFAYFTSTGSGTGAATVGSASAWTVTAGAATGGPLYPGSGTQTISYTVTNPSSGVQSLAGTSAAVASYTGTAIPADAGDVTHNGVPVAGCLASWFTAANTAPTPLPQNLAGSATSTAGSVAVTMQDSGTSQNVCQGATPDITVSAS